MNLLSYQATWHLTEGYEPTRHARSAHPSLVPFQLFPASDGWLVIGCAKEKFWLRLTEVLGHPELAQDPRFLTFAERKAHRVELESILDGVLATRTVARWLEVLREAGVPSGPVNTVEQALREEHAVARDTIVSTVDDAGAKVWHVNSPVRVGPARVDHDPAPARGEHTESILRDLLGYDDATIARLAAAAAFGG